MNELKVFENQEFGKVRTVEIGNAVWFVGKDVADILGYQNGSRDINRHVDEEDRHKVMLFDGIKDKETIIINESGLYSLILSSKLPSAKKFKRWVTSEILPSIRKHGLYATDELIANPDIAIAAFTALKEEREKTKVLQTEIAVKDQVIQEFKPKIQFYDTVLDSDEVVSVSKIALQYGMTATAFNKKLNEMGIQYRRGKSWCLYCKYLNKGYANVKTGIGTRKDGTEYSYTYLGWTQKGRKFLYDLFSEYGILPLLELEYSSFL